jgi:hypothetical protein
MFPGEVLALVRGDPDEDRILEELEVREVL